MATRNTDVLSVPLLEDSTMSTINDSKNRKKLPWDKILTVVYILFLCWQLIAVCLYLVRAFTCFQHKIATYTCEENAAFPHSATVELCWLITRCLQIIIAVALLPRLTDFPGFKAVMRQLKSLSQFWSLFFLLLAALSRYAVLFVFSERKTSFYFPLVIFFALSKILRVIAVSILNVTKLNSVKHQSTIPVLVFTKLTFLIMFIDNLLPFLTSLLAFSMEVKDLGHQDEIKYSRDVLSMYHILEKFGTSFFYFKIMNFFWQKLFSDETNILSSHSSHSSAVE